MGAVGFRSVKPRTDNSLESLAQDSAEVIYKGKSPYEKMFIYFILTFALGLMGTLIVPDTKGNWLPLDFSLKEQMSPELQTTTSITSFLYCLSVGGRKQGQLLPTTCSRIFTHIHCKLPTGLLLTGHKSEFLDALLD